jgi:hypothetical protein
MDGWMDGMMDGWVSGWMDVIATLRTAYNNKNCNVDTMLQARSIIYLIGVH